MLYLRNVVSLHNIFLLSDIYLLCGGVGGYPIFPTNSPVVLSPNYAVF